MNNDAPNRTAADLLALEDPARRAQMDAEIERRVAERTRQLETQSRETEAALRQARWPPPPRTGPKRSFWPTYPTKSALP